VDYWEKPEKEKPKIQNPVAVSSRPGTKPAWKKKKRGKKHSTKKGSVEEQGLKSPGRLVEGQPSLKVDLEKVKGIRGGSPVGAALKGFFLKNGQQTQGGKPKNPGGHALKCHQDWG